MKIKYTSKYLPLWKQRNNLTSEEELLLIQLEENTNFEKEILKIRKKFNIPLQGWPEKQMGTGELGEKIEVIDMLSDKADVLKKERVSNCLVLPANNDYYLLLYYSQSVCRLCRLPEYWDDPILWYTLFNVLYLLPQNYPPITNTSEYPSQRRYINTSDAANNLILVINQKISKNQFHKWINDEWNLSLEREINKLPKNFDSKVEQLKVYRRIAELKKMEKSFEEIADILYQEGDGSYGYESISMMYIRYKRYLLRK